jgi:hypothetical protein
MERYQKQGIYLFVLTKGALTGVVFACVLFLQPETFPDPPSLFQILLCLIVGWLFCLGLWFFVGWYFNEIKKRLNLQSNSAITSSKDQT